MATLSELYLQRATAEQQLSAVRQSIAAIDEQITAATAERVRQMYTLSGKQSGTVTVDGGDGIEIKADISKKVEWDTAVLMGVARTMPWDRAQEVFDIKFAVPEKKYKTLSSELRAQLDEGRVTKYGDIKITLVKKES